MNKQLLSLIITLSVLASPAISSEFDVELSITTHNNKSLADDVTVSHGNSQKQILLAPSLRQSAGLAFTIDDISDEYVSDFYGVLDEPNIITGVADTYLKIDSNGAAFTIGDSGKIEYQWSISNSVMTLLPKENPATIRYVRLEELLALNLVDQASIDFFKQNSNEQWITVEIRPSYQQWQLIENQDKSDTFYIEEYQEYFLSDDTERSLLWGGIDASSKVALSNEHLSTFIDVNYLTQQSTGFSSAMLSGQSFTLGLSSSALTSFEDVVTFAVDGQFSTYYSSISGQWSVMPDKTLTLTYKQPNSDGADEDYSVSFLLLEQQRDSFSYLSLGDGSKSGYFSNVSLGINWDQNANFNELQNTVLVSSFITTKNTDLTDTGGLGSDELFGFRLLDDGLANRVLGSYASLLNRGFNDTYWEQDEFGKVTLSSRTDLYEGYDFYRCDPIANEMTCLIFQKRHWLPLKRIGKRIYVLEWIDRLDEFWYGPLPEDRHFSLFRKPRINFYEVIEHDWDDDSIPDEIEINLGLDPNNSEDGEADFDNDGLTNAEEISLGTDIYNSDSDGDGVNDKQEVTAGSDPLDPASKPESSLVVQLFSDVNGDNVIDWLQTTQLSSSVEIKLLSGNSQLMIQQYSINHSFDFAKIVLLDDRDNDTVIDVGVFGFDSSTNRYQLIVHNGKSGERIDVWNWPATLGEVKFEVLADLTGDGIQEYAISGVHLANGTRQLVVKDGVTKAAYQTFKWPNLWDKPQFVTMSDVTLDGIQEVALYGRHSRLDKGQLFVYDGADANAKVDVYNWNKLWNDIQLFEMDDLDSDGTLDWGQFGQRKDDGRYQWIVKKGHDKRGVIRTFSWPNDLVDVKPMLVADRTGDGIREVAVLGTHPDSGKVFVRINDGRLANERIANISWPASWEDIQVTELGDLNNDGFSEFGLLGFTKSNRTVQLIVRDGQTAAEYGRYTLSGQWEDLSLSHYDANADGIEDVAISGLNQTTKVTGVTVLSGIDLSLIYSQ